MRIAKYLLIGGSLCLLILSVLHMPKPTYAASYTAVQDGNWDDTATWGGTVPTSTDEVTIPSGITVTIPVVVTVSRDAGTTLIVNGSLVNYGTVTNNVDATVTNNYNLANNGTFTNAGTLNNSATGSILNVATFSNPGTINNQGVFTSNPCTGSYSGNAPVGNAIIYVPCSTASFTPTFTQTPTGTGCFVPPSADGNSLCSPTNTRTPSPTPSTTNTPSPMPSATNTPSPTPSPTDTPSSMPSATDTPSPTPSPTSCSFGASVNGLCGATNTPIASPTLCTNVATAPSLNSPVHRTHTTDTTPSFSWSTVTGAQSYRIMVYSEDRSFEFKQRVFVASYTLKAGEALSPAKYLWRVRTQDSLCATWTGWSSRSTLFVD